MTKRLHGPLAGPLLALALLAPAASAEIRFCGRTDLRLGTVSPWAVVLGDFYPGDGPDLAITFGTNDEIQLWRNDGTGSFTRTDTIRAGAAGTASTIADPAAIVAADVNGDGLVDIVGTNKGETKFFAFHNPGVPGTWGAPADPDAMRADGNDATLVDWNGDGALDLVVGQDAGFVSIALGETSGGLPTGTWAAANRFPTTETVGVVMDVEAGMFIDPPAHPGVMDVLTVDQQYGQLVIWPGSATLIGRVLSDPADLVTIPVTQPDGSAATPIEAIVRDWQPDGRLDALVVTTQGYVLYYRGNGTAGVFDAPVRQDLVAGLGLAGRMPTDWTAASYVDVTGDAVRDLVIADAGDASSERGFNWLTVVRGLTDAPAAPTFDAAAQDHYAMDDMGTLRAGSLATGDIDQDSDVDVIVLHGDRASLTILRNDGTGTFDAPFSFSAGGRLPRGAAAGFLDGDGFEDVVTALGSPSDAALRTAVMLPGTGGDELGAPVALVAPGLDVPSAVHVASVNSLEDADLDVVVTFSADQVLWEGGGDGTFAAPVTLGSPGRLALAQALGGPELDAITADRGTDSVRVQRGDGRGAMSLQQSLPDVSYSQVPAVGPLFNTGGSDIIVAGSDRFGTTHGIYIITWNAGTGRYDAPVLQESAPLIGVNTDFVHLEIAELDGTPPLEILAFTSGGDAAVLEPSGTSLIIDPVTPFLTFGGSPTGVVVRDLTGDGVVDIAVADRNTIRIREGAGGAFGPLVTLPTNVDNAGLVAADVDGDGLPELVTVSTRTNDLTVFCNDSVGSLILRVGRPFTRDTLSWTDQGAGATYFVASGDLNSLWADRDFRSATCLATTAATTHVDARALPAPAAPTFRSAFYYMVKCTGPDCTEPTFGFTSLGQPRFGPASPGAIPDPCP